ncbi:hypothetical protein CDCA_CDCA08G2336 [Cyanidium caldarium]|uniref:Protein kinase domain-containing protein n=1 Tax=Cyanidium caldarium TaxID=2771 RepID=A0AAV9IW28_CYACA|nr:hypothetical protein CDCA_CDCA08G2336 [Cyanidium caldarium]
MDPSRRKMPAEDDANPRTLPAATEAEVVLPPQSERLCDEPDRVLLAKPLNLVRRKEAPWKIRDDSIYLKLEQVGEGTYGEVYHARNQETQQEVALKRLRMANEREGFPLTACREIKVLRELRHQNIVNLVEMVTSHGGAGRGRKGDISMVFEYMDHDLTGLLDTPGIRFTESQVKCYTQQLLSGVAYCHARNVLHRDIKGSNLLINQRGQLKIADFGLARFAGEPGRRYTTRVVTLWYRAPELLLGEGTYSFAVDMWSVGCLILEMLMGKPVFPGKDEATQVNLIFSVLGTPTQETWPGVQALPYANTFLGGADARRYPNVFRSVFEAKGVSRVALDLIERLLTLCPSERMTAEEALQHAWFTTEPLPSRPEELPKYESTHEYQARRRRQAERSGATMMPTATRADGGMPPLPAAASMGYGAGYAPPAMAPPPAAAMYTGVRRPSSQGASQSAPGRVTAATTTAGRPMTTGDRAARPRSTHRGGAVANGAESTAPDAKRRRPS